MKIFLRSFFVSFLGFFLMLPSMAQESSQNVIKANIFSPLVRTGSFFYERSMNEAMSIQFGFFYTGISVLETSFSGFGITPEFRYYMSEKRVSPSGVFIAPYLRYQSFNLTTEIDDGKASYSAMGGGLLVGYQSVVRNRISIEAFIGPAYSVGNVKVEAGDAGSFDVGYFDGFGVRTGVTVGLAF